MSRDWSLNAAARCRLVDNGNQRVDLPRINADDTDLKNQEVKQPMLSLVAFLIRHPRLVYPLAK